MFVLIWRSEPFSHGQPHTQAIREVSDNGKGTVGCHPISLFGVVFWSVLLMVHNGKKLVQSAAKFKCRVTIYGFHIYIQLHIAIS